MVEQFIAIFCYIDDFCKEYESYFTTHLPSDKEHVCEHIREYFPHLVSYNRFVEIMQSSVVPLTLFLMSK